MSGPALTQKSSHQAIHEAALGEARELTALLRKMWWANEASSRLIEMAYLLVEHWETRTLAHADAEENGLYVKAVELHPELKERVGELTSEHDSLRKLVEEIKGILPTSGVNERVLFCFDSLVTVDEQHNEHEENYLLESTLWEGD